MKSLRASFIILAATITLPVTFTLADTEINNPLTNNCGISISGDNWICVNDNDDDNDEKWDFETEPVVGEKDTKMITVTATADKNDATVTVSIETGSDKIDGFWQGTLTLSGQSPTGSELDGQEKRSSKKTTFTVPKGSSATQTLYIEGIKHSDSLKDVKINAKIEAPAGTTPEDEPFSECNMDATPLELTVYQVDLDIDSNNDNEFAFAGFNDAEDKIENSINMTGSYVRPGKIVAPTSNKNTDNDDLPDYADGFSLVGAGSLTESATVTGDLQFVPVQIELKAPFNPATATATFQLPTESKPQIGAGLQTVGDGTETSPKVIGVTNGGIRLWRKKSDARTSGAYVPAGDLVPSGESISWADIADGAGSRFAKLYLEYLDINNFQMNGKKDIKVTIREDDVECEDTVKVLFAPVDTDVDSDNNDNKAQPGRTLQEEGYQYAHEGGTSAHEKPGKMLYVHSGDEDYDGIPDYADGFVDKFQNFGIASNSGVDDGSNGFVPQGSQLVPMILDIPAFEYPEERIFVRLEYEDSDPNQIEREQIGSERVRYKLPDTGTLRVWTKDCYALEDGLRSVQPVLNNGHFVKAGVDMPMSVLRPKLKVATAGGYVLYVESLRKSQETRDQKITVRVGVTSDDLGGAPHWIYDETVHFTSLEMNLVAIGENGETHRTDSYGLSHSSPVITLTQNEVSEPKYNSYDSRWEVDITIAGTVKSDFLDTVPEAQGGVINQVFVYLNNSDDPIPGQPGGVITFVPQKGSDPGSLTKPFPYLGVFSATIPGVPVPDGKNIISVRTRDQVFQVDGVVASSFTAEYPSEPPSPPDGGGVDPPPGDTSTTLRVVTQYTIELLDGLATDAVNHLKYTVAATGSAAVDLEYEETGNDTFDFIAPLPNTHTLELQKGLTLDPGKRDTIATVFRNASGEPYAELLLYETGKDTKIFSAPVTEWVLVGGGGGDPVETVVITNPVVFYETDGGEFHPHAFELEGPRDLILKFEELKFIDPTHYELPGASISTEFTAKIKVTDDKVFLANTASEEAVAIVAFRENLEGDQFPSVSEQIYASIAKLQTACLYPNDIGKFEKGFGMGIVKGGVDMVGGLADGVKLGCKAVYAGGKAVVRAQVFQLKCIWKLVTGQKLDEEVRQMCDASDSLTKKFEYFKTIETEGIDAITAILEGKYERLNNLSGAMKDMVSMGAELFGGLVGAITTDDDYEKGIFWGRATFEVGSAFFPLAKVGSVGKLAFMNKIKTIKFFTEPGGVGARALERAAHIIELLPTSRMCFLAGTAVWTANGMVPIEAIRAGDLVWSRSDIDPGEAALKPVLHTVVTHPTLLVTLSIDQNGDGHPDDILKGTPQHPFWVEEFRAFVPMGELKPGQTLHLVDGRCCSVLTSATLRGPPNATLTTYNFEVADFHTYFVGSQGVWVHNNTNSRSPCDEVLEYVIERKEKHGRLHWESFDDAATNLGKGRNSSIFGWAAHQTMKDLMELPIEQRAAQWPTYKTVRKTMKKVVGPLPDDTDEILSHMEVPEWIKQERVDLAGINQLKLESNHGIPKEVQSWLGMTKDVDNCPAYLTTMLEHRGQGVGFHQTLARKLGDAIDENGPAWNLNQGRPPLTNIQIMTAMEKTYELWSLTPFWEVCKLFAGQ